MFDKMEELANKYDWQFKLYKSSGGFSAEVIIGNFHYFGVALTIEVAILKAIDNAMTTTGLKGKV